MPNWSTTTPPRIRRRSTPTMPSTSPLARRCSAAIRRSRRPFWCRAAFRTACRSPTRAATRTTNSTASSPRRRDARPRCAHRALPRFPEEGRGGSAADQRRRMGLHHRGAQFGEERFQQSALGGVELGGCLGGGVAGATLRQLRGLIADDLVARVIVPSRPPLSCRTSPPPYPPPCREGKVGVETVARGSAPPPPGPPGHPPRKGEGQAPCP